MIKSSQTNRSFLNDFLLNWIQILFINANLTKFLDNKDLNSVARQQGTGTWYFFSSCDMCNCFYVRQPCLLSIRRAHIESIFNELHQEIIWCSSEFTNYIMVEIPVKEKLTAAKTAPLPTPPSNLFCGAAVTSVALHASPLIHMQCIILSTILAILIHHFTIQTQPSTVLTKLSSAQSVHNTFRTLTPKQWEAKLYAVKCAQ